MSVLDERRVDTVRLLAGADDGQRVDLATHRRLHGALPRLVREQVVDAAATTGLRGRGGGGFPFAQKLAAVPAGRRTSVVLNGSESEPASGKDRVLMRLAPHLVLDGARVAADVLGTDRVVVTVHHDAAADALAVAVAERDDAAGVQVVRSGGGFVAGEARAVLNGLDGRRPVPDGRRVLPHVRGVGGDPSLVSNVETFAHLGLLALHGPAAVARIGTADEAGTVLLTALGDVDAPGVVEVPTGADAEWVLGTRPVDAPLLVGGYHGAWLPGARGVVLDRTALATRGATLGAGVVVRLPRETCALGEVGRVAAWLAAQSARQCGPCVFGLGAVADDLARLLVGDRDADPRSAERHLALTEGRGACAHPDGAVRFVRSALVAMPDEVLAHAHHGTCHRPVLGVLPIGGPR